MKENENSVKDKLILVDGQELAKLMIAHGVGFSKQTTYTIMQIDNDYFEE